MDMSVSVVIPALDEEEQLPGTLAAVREALGPDVEVIVADGGSRDETRRIAGARARLVESGRGRGRQLNAGAAVASGDVLLFLHADTRPRPGARAALERALASEDVVGGCFAVELRGPSVERPIARIVGWAISARSGLFRTATGDQGIFVRARTFRAIGGFPDCELFEDVLFYRALRGRGKVVVLRPAVTTSDRRWRARGYARTILTHLAFRALHLAGASPSRLARRYPRPG